MRSGFAFSSSVLDLTEDGVRTPLSRSSQAGKENRGTRPSVMLKGVRAQVAGIAIDQPGQSNRVCLFCSLVALWYLRVHLADALIAASAWVKNLPIVTTNLRHFQQIRKIEVIPFSMR